MDVREFLLTSKLINRSEVARLMWPKNAAAKNYLTAKLNQTDDRTFTRKDALKAIEVLKQLNVDLSSLTVADKY